MKSLDLENRYRPRRVEDLAGQGKAIEVLAPYVKSGSTKSLLLVGPTGTGKTSAGRAIAAPWVCDQGPCSYAECDICDQLFVRGVAGGYFELDTPVYHGPEHSKRISELLGGSNLFDITAFVDEAHRLDAAAQDALLKAAETPHQRTRLILATTAEDVHKIRTALRTRCLTIQFSPIKPAEIVRSLRSIAVNEGISAEQKALEMVAFGAEGSLRSALNCLELLASAGPITSATAALHLSRGNVDHLLAYFRAVIAGDQADQDVALDAWSIEPGEKVKLIRDCLLNMYNHHIAPSRSNDVVNAALFLLGDPDRVPLVEGFRNRARTLGLTVGEFFLSMAENWDAQMNQVRDRASLLIKARRFTQLIGGSALRADLNATVQAETASEEHARMKFRSRSAKFVPRSGANSNAEQRYLDQAQAEHIYEMTSFMGQHYGALFNSRIKLNHSLLGTNRSEAAGAIVSQLMHELSLRCASWGGDEVAHWVYCNREEGGRFSTQIAIHVPTGGLPKAADWLDQRISALCPAAEKGGIEHDFASASRQSGFLKNRIQRHWSLVRPLWGCLDPHIVDWDTKRRRHPLVDLLRVPRSDRRALGRLGKMRAIGASRSLGKKARSAAEDHKMGLLSAVRDDAWAAVESGWELSEHKDRHTELELRRDAIARLDHEFGNAQLALEQQAKEKALRELYAQWPANPRDRPRSWTGWWAISAG